jgi:hypothetical protein
MCQYKLWNFYMSSTTPVPVSSSPLHSSLGGSTTTTTLGGQLLINIQVSGRPYVSAMTATSLLPTERTMAAWQTLAGEITALVMDPTTGVPNQANATQLSSIFSEIDQHCDNQLYGGTPISSALSPIAQHLLGGSQSTALPGIELFAKQATQVLGAIANNTTATGILKDGFFPQGTTIGNSSVTAAGYGAALTSPPAVEISALLTGTTDSPNLDAQNFFENIANAT